MWGDTAEVHTSWWLTSASVGQFPLQYPSFFLCAVVNLCGSSGYAVQMFEWLDGI